MAKRPAKIIESTVGEPAETTPRHAITLLEQVIGQSQAKGVLQGAMQSGRVHHAWIFHGPAGVGKFTAAVAFCAALLDSTLSPDLGGNLAPEPDSQVQQLVKAGTHPDLHVITKELAAISREQTVRDGKQLSIAKAVVDEFLLEPSQRSRVLTGASKAGKAFIIDEAEMMNAATQNAILKTLEEPPEGTVIVLVTSSEDRLLTTIRSRCQRVAFTPLSDQEMTAWVKSREEFAATKGGEREWLLRFAQGSPGAALSAVEHGLFAWQEALGPLLDTIGRGKYPPEMAGAMHKLIGEQAEAAVKVNPDASKDAANKAWMRRMLSFIAEDLRQRLRAQTAGKTAEQVQEDMTAQRILAAIDVVVRTEQQMYSNVNQQLLLENLVAQMCAEPVGV